MIASYLDSLSYVIISLLKQQAFYFTLLFIPAFAISYLLRHKPPLLLLCLWTLVLLRLILPPDFASPISAREIFETFLSTEISSPRALEELRDYQFGASNGSTPAITLLPVTLTWNSLIALSWAVIVGCLLTRYLLQRTNCYRQLGRSKNADRETLALFDHWRRQLEIRRPVTLHATDQTSSPFTIGTFKPAVAIPQRLIETLPQEQLEAIIAHELTHVKRLDDAWINFQQLLQRVFFFVPAIWLCNGQIYRLRELVVDHAVLTHARISSRNYGRAMLAVLEMNRSAVKTPVASFISAREYYGIRFKSLGKAPKKTRRAQITEWLLMIAALLVVLPMAPTKESLNAERQRMFALSEHLIPQLTTRFSQPLDNGVISHPFGMRKSDLGVINTEEVHAGVDIDAPVGSPLYAVADGTVVVVAMSPKDDIGIISGGYLVLRHSNGLHSLYTPVAGSTLHKGDRVAQSQLIGYLARSRSAMNVNAHLHFEMSRQGIRVDPAKIIDFSNKSLHLASSESTFSTPN